jgi:hypothetical protein
LNRIAIRSGIFLACDEEPVADSQLNTPTWDTKLLLNRPVTPCIKVSKHQHVHVFTSGALARGSGTWANVAWSSTSPLQRIFRDKPLWITLGPVVLQPTHVMFAGATFQSKLNADICSLIEALSMVLNIITNGCRPWIHVHSNNLQALKAIYGHQVEGCCRSLLKVGMELVSMVNERCFLQFRHVAGPEATQGF